MRGPAAPTRSRTALVPDPSAPGSFSSPGATARRAVWCEADLARSTAGAAIGRIRTMPAASSARPSTGLPDPYGAGSAYSTTRGMRLLDVDGWSRASSTAAATNTSALFGIYRWGWGFSTSQRPMMPITSPRPTDFNGDIALIACFASSWTPAMVRRWHADPFGFCAPGTSCPRSWGARHPSRPPRPARAWSSA